MTYYLNNFENQRDVENEFGLTEGYLDDCDIFLADYTYESYSGSAFVLFRKEGKLYEVHGSHCSCYGLENQFDPEVTSVEALEHYLEKGEYSYKEYAEELREIINTLKRGKGMKKVVFYEASDGTRFDNEQECRQYEEMAALAEFLTENVNVASTIAAQIAAIMVDNFEMKRKK